jgi:hypothetical protein
VLPFEGEVDKPCRASPDSQVAPAAFPPCVRAEEAGRATLLSWSTVCHTFVTSVSTTAVGRRLPQGDREICPP